MQSAQDSLSGGKDLDPWNRNQFEHKTSPRIISYHHRSTGVHLWGSTNGASRLEEPLPSVRVRRTSLSVAPRSTGLVHRGEDV